MTQMPRTALLLLLPLLLIAAACGSGPSSAPEDTPIPAGVTPPGNSERFVFGASPGKPAVYWIHTDW
jgi:hypothetical protein